MGSAWSPYAAARCSSRTNSSRGTRAIASSTRGSRTPRCRSCPTMSSRVTITRTYSSFVGDDEVALARLRHDPDIRSRRAPATRVRLLRVLVGDRARDDDVVALLPVHRSCHLVLRGELHRVDDTQHLVEVA